MSAVPTLDLDALEDDDPSCHFVLGGRTWKVRSPQDLSWSAVERMMVADTDDPTKAQVQVKAFFEAVLIPDQVADFLVVLSEGGSKVTLKRVEALTQFVVEKVFPNHPTKRPSASSPGSENKGPTSTGASSARATRPKASASSPRSTSSTRRGRSSATTRSLKTG